MEYHIFKDGEGFWRWHLLAANRRKIADSGEGYHNKQDCLDAIGLVQASAGAPVREH
jgi:uncharacterized protein YegP (UPF0339 family)